MEIWNAYDENLNVIENVTLVRDEPVPNGLYHLVSDIIVRHTDGTYLLMLRDKRKHFGNMWEASAGGSALFGESPLECAVRELKEETGIVSGEFQEIGKVVEKGVIYVEYLCITDCDKDAVTLQDGETSDFKWVDQETLRNMTSDCLVTYRVQDFIAELRRT